MIAVVTNVKYIYPLLHLYSNFTYIEYHKSAYDATFIWKSALKCQNEHRKKMNEWYNEIIVMA